MPANLVCFNNCYVLHGLEDKALVFGKPSTP